MKQRERRRRLRVVKPVSELVDRVLSGYHVAEDVRKRRILTQWSHIVGSRIASNTVPGRVLDGVLEVRVRSSSWMQELSFMTEDIVARVNQAIGNPPLLHDIRWSLGRPRHPRPRPPAGRQPGAGHVVPPSPASPERAAHIARESEEVEDEELRALITDVRKRYDL